MTAKELFEALQGVPEDAIAPHVGYDAENDTWMYLPPSLAWNDLDGHKIEPDHAAALQRDSMWLWLNKRSVDVHVRQSHCHYGETWAVMNSDVYGYSTTDSLHKSALAALASACRYVAGQKGADK